MSPPLPAGAWVVAACAGVQALPAIPSQAVGWALLLAGLLLVCAAVLLALRVRRFRQWLIVPGTVVAAVGWAMVRADAAMASRVPQALEGEPLKVIGVVDDMPQPIERGIRFRFAVERCETNGRACPQGLGLRVNWSQPMGKGPPTPVPAVRAGQRWQLHVKVRRPHSPINPGLFDSELRALEEGVDGMGSVRARPDPAAPNLLLDEFVFTVHRVVERARGAIRDRIAQVLADQPAAARGVVSALVVGDQAAIPSSWWETFNRTGIGHLISISGLHITMLAAVGAGLAGKLWSNRRLAAAMRRRPLPALLPTPYARWVAGLVVAFGYAALAGWGIPAQRTCWMLAAAGGALLSGRGRSTPAVLGTAAAIVCVLDPWAPLAPGFWLSFAAVASIIWAGSWRGGKDGMRAQGPHQRRGNGQGEGKGEDQGEGQAERQCERQGEGQCEGQGGRWHQWRERVRPMLAEALRSQVAATLVLLPLGVLFFSSVSLVSPLANAFAIPLVSGVITPLALAGAALAMVWAPLGEPMLLLAAWLSRGLLWALQWLDLGGMSALPVALPGTGALLLAAFACAVLLAPIQVPARLAAVFALCPVLLTPAQGPPPGEAWLTAIDVGQGMALLVEAGGRRLLYDTGPQMGLDADAGGRFIVPYLRARGISHLDAVVVSHLDLDHSGGALSVLRGVSVDWLASSIDPGHAIATASARFLPCRRGDRWRWGEVSFEWLHPGPGPEGRVRSATNARSCVLRIQTPGGVVLLPGDLEAAQESRLLELFSEDRLGADVLLAPHHGSATSSTQAFLEAVHPKVAIFQLGYRNRYHHPNPAVMLRYLDAGVEALRSDSHGTITVRLRQGAPPSVARLRLDDGRYWRIRVEPPVADSLRADVTRSVSARHKRSKSSPAVDAPVAGTTALEPTAGDARVGNDD